MEIVANAGSKPLKLETARGHITQALMRGRTVDIARLAAESQWPLPDWTEWAAIEQAAAARGINPVLPDVRAKDLVATILETQAGNDGGGAAAAASARVKRCYDCITWWTTLKRAGYSPVFEGGAGGDEGSMKRRKID
jgi:hypothetical protein